MGSRPRIDPVALFLQEHDHALVQLASLNRAVRSLEENGFTAAAFRRVLDGVAFIKDEVGDHNTREEEALFPVLERYVEGPTAVMRREHRILRTRYTRLARATSRLEKNPKSKAALKELSLATKGVLQLLVNHIHKENHILFPLVQKFLTRDALREVARRMV
jgi:hemerythrin-like domain-containing protein